MNKKFLIIFIGLTLAIPPSFAENQNKLLPDTKIVLERTACYGTCPDYRLTIYADGKVEFEGRQYVKETGRHLKTIPSENVTMMWAELGAAKFFELKGNYDCQDITDNPTAIITVTKEGKATQITHYHGCKSANKEALASLTKLENKIDELANIADWLK